MSIKARLTALLLHMQQSRSDIYGCQVSGGQIEKVYYRSQPMAVTPGGEVVGSWVAEVAIRDWRVTGSPLECQSAGRKLQVCCGYSQLVLSLL